MSRGRSLLAFMDRGSRGAVAFDLACLTGVFLLLNRALLVPGTTLVGRGFTDLRTLSQPAYVFTGRSLAAGHIPWWNPYWFAGYPHFEMDASAVFYPTTILYGLLPFASLVKLDVLGHVLVFVLGGYWLGRDFLGSRLGGLCLGFLLMVVPNGPTIVEGGQLWSAHLFAWIPIAWLLLRRTIAGSDAWALGLAAVLALQALAGAAQLFVHELLLLGSYAAFELVRRRWRLGAPWPKVIRKGIVCLVGVVLGLGMAAIVLVPSELLLRESIHGHGVTYAFFTGIGDPGNRLRLLFDVVLPDATTPPLAAGVLGLGLLFYGILRGPDDQRFVLVATVLVCFFYAVPPVWLWESVLRHVPGLGGGRLSIRIAFMLRLAVAVLSTIGLVTLARARELGRSPAREWALIAVLCAASGLVTWTRQGALVPSAVAAAALPAVLAGAVWCFPQRLALATTGLVLVLVVEGVAAQAPTVRTGMPEDLAVPESFRTFSAARQGLDRIAVFSGTDILSPLSPNVGSLTGVRVLGGFHGLVLDDFAKFVEALLGVDVFETDDEGRVTRQRTGLPMKDWIREDRLRGLDLLNVRWLVSGGGDLRVPEKLAARGGGGAAPRFTRREHDGLVVYENRDALPVAYVVHEVEVFEDDDAARRRLRSPDFDPTRRVVLTGPFDPSRLAPAQSAETVSVARYENAEVELNVALGASGLVVLTDVIHPGWHVSVDGEVAELLRVNTLVRGVVVPAGRHHVRFVYRPARLALAASVSVLAATLWVAAAVVSWRRQEG